MTWKATGQRKKLCEKLTKVKNPSRLHKKLRWKLTKKQSKFTEKLRETGQLFENVQS